MREMFRVLRPAGQSLILDGDRDCPWGWLLYDVLVSWAKGACVIAPRGEMRELGDRAGFSQIRQFHNFPLAPVLLTVGVAQK